MEGTLTRRAAVTATVGGAAWLTGTVIHASQPVGCVGGDCAAGSLRESGAVVGILTLVALVLLALTATALVALTRRAGRTDRSGTVGVVLALAGAVVLAIAGLVNAVLFDGDFSLMPYFVWPALLALVVGFVLLGVMVLRSGVLPRWAALALLTGTALLVGFNEQTTAAWLGVPFGLAWIAVGYALWAAGRSGRAVAGPQPLSA